MQQEHAEFEREIGHCGDGGRPRDHAHDMNRRILKDDEGPPRFARASQNIVVAPAFLEELLEPTTLEGRHTHKKMCVLFERAARQQS